MEKCRRELRADHIDLDAYATPSDAHDLVLLCDLSASGCARAALVCARYGYQRIDVLFRRESWAVNHKRIQRL
jgi:hypothetical protein